MAVSKRLRYEILRRDNHTCRYCGGVAPNVELRVDHVIPRALGGSDEPSNLIAACHDCNSGKTSSAPDQNVVDDANQKALQWATAMAQAASEMADHSTGRTELYAAVSEVFPAYYRRNLPNDMGTTIDQLINVGLPAQVIVDMAKVAAGKSGVGDRWRYFCGCCWTKVRQMQDRAMELVGDAPEQEEPTVSTVSTVSWDIVDLPIHFAMAHLLNDLPDENVRVRNAFECFHEIPWKVQDVSRSIHKGVDYPCEDVACIAAYGEYLSSEERRCSDNAARDRAVMDMAEAMESV